MPRKNDSCYRTRAEIESQTGKLAMHSLAALEKNAGRKISLLPRSLRILLENLLRHEDGDIVRREDIDAVLAWDPKVTSKHEIQFTPARVLLQDFTGVPVITDLAAMRSRLEETGGKPSRVNPLQPVDLIIDHSVQVDAFGTKDALATNARFEFERNKERYEFLKWGQDAFTGLRVVPPATGICHQVNLEYLAFVAMRGKYHDEDWVYPDTLVGTDSHTPMVNGLGVLGWGVGGIEAEAAMLGQPISMLIPDVIGVELKGRLRAGVTATDLVLTVTQMLRKRGVVGTFIEFTGDGVHSLPIADRATLSNMAPEYGATVGYWPIDKRTVEYLRLTGRGDRADLTEKYYRAQGLWAEPGQPLPIYSDLLSLDLGSVETSLAGPAKPHDRSSLSGVKTSFTNFLQEQKSHRAAAPAASEGRLRDGALVIAAITSCTNTSNPALMLGAALLARNAGARGLRPAPWVKTSFAPGSRAVTGYLESADLMKYLDALGFNLVGYGCTTCIGNSGPLPADVAAEVDKRKLVVAAVLSGNRNFEARIHPQVRANYLASPPLVVAFAIAGRIDIDLDKEPLGRDKEGKDVFLRDVWPDGAEVEALIAKHVTPQRFSTSYASIFDGDEQWRSLGAEQSGESYAWKDDSSYIRKPPFLDPEYANESGERPVIQNARVLALFGDFITTDHISPAGSIGDDTPAGKYLLSLGIQKKDFNSYGSRRGNHEVMMRGTFANVRLRNQLVEREGGYTLFWPNRSEMTIYDAAMKYRETKTPLVIFAGREYGSGSSRDWAAKGTRLLGVRAVIARSFERIHRSNLIGMGVLPLEFASDVSTESLGLTGEESVSIDGLKDLKPKSALKVRVKSPKGGEKSFDVVCRVDTANELRYFDAGGILPYVLTKLR